MLSGDTSSLSAGWLAGLAVSSAAATATTAKILLSRGDERRPCSRLSAWY